MDRLVNADVKELNLLFTAGKKCSTTFRLTNLMHTMSIAVSLNTTNPSTLSIIQPFSIIPPLGTGTFTLILSKPSDHIHHPPISAPPDTVIVRSTMLPTGKASSEDLRRLFSKPGPHIFKDAVIPISFVGPRVIEFLISSTVTKTLETAFALSKAISWCDVPEITSLLFPAARAGNSYVVSALLDAGADVSKPGPDGESVMSLAIRSGSIDTVRILVEAECVVSETDRFLHDAGFVGRADIMEVLWMGYLDLDANSVNADGQTPLHVGAENGNVEVLEFLVRLGCDSDVADYNGWTALHCAAVNGHVEAVGFLLNVCKYVKYAVNNKGKTAFDLAVENGHTGLYDMLCLGDVLHRAARKGDVDEMTRCLEEGAVVNVNGKDQNGWTPLHKCAFKGHIEGVKLLLNYGGLVDVVDGSGYTALHRAVEGGHAEVAMMLIGHGAKANMKSLAVPFDFECYKKCNGPLRRKIERA